jgi:hypothetical protein
MLPHQAAYFVRLLVLSIAFASLYINIRTAKKKVKQWKGYSTYWFWRSQGLFGIENRAKLVWMKEEGYDEAESLVLARYQSRAIFRMVFGGVFLMTLAANCIER